MYTKILCWVPYTDMIWYVMFWWILWSNGHLVAVLSSLDMVRFHGKIWGMAWSIWNSKHHGIPKVTYGTEKKSSLMDWQFQGRNQVLVLLLLHQNGGSTHLIYALIKLHDYTSLLKTFRMYCIKLFDFINMPDSEMIHLHHFHIPTYWFRGW